MRLALIGGLAAIAMALVACGGGTSDSIKYAATVVPIKHLDLSGEALSAASFFQPPFADQYPPVVATVNGKPVTGEQLAAQEVVLELSRRQWTADYQQPFPQDYVKAQLKTIESTDPLGAPIDEALMSQAVERLGLSPTHDEAVAYTREQEANSDKALASMPPDKRAQEIDMMRQEGLPETDWASSDTVVARYGYQLGASRLATKACPKYRTPTPVVTLPPEYLGFANLGRGDPCEGFLAQERKNADIVYYVRWAD